MTDDATSRGGVLYPESVESAEPAGRGPLSLIDLGPVRETGELSYAADLNLDQVIEAVASRREQAEYVSKVLRRPLREEAAVRYRQDAFSDLREPRLRAAADGFCADIHRVRVHLEQIPKMHSKEQAEGWLLDAAAIYLEATSRLLEALESADLHSEALTRCRQYLRSYRDSEEISRLERDITSTRQRLAAIDYCTRIKGSRVEVSRYEGQPDYSVEVLKTFERFKQGSVKDYRVQYRSWPGMHHVAAQIASLVARLFPEEFQQLERFCDEHRNFWAEDLFRFDAELQFYLAYLAYIEPMELAGLQFTLPEVSATSKEVQALATFDVALASKLVSGREEVVTNDFELHGAERIFVVSGPNQGGKTTFARTFGQLHHLAAVGCPVPGKAAKLFLFDQLFAHFEREEDLANLSGKLEDDLRRIARVLEAATPESIVIMNEIFSSTTLEDARFLGEKVMRKLIQLDVLGVYVTFIDELAAMGPSVVSLMSRVLPDNPAERTFKVVRAPADGLAYALALADKHHVTFKQLRSRLEQRGCGQ